MGAKEINAEISQYEMLRVKNLKEREHLLAALMQDAKELNFSLKEPKKSPVKPKIKKEIYDNDMPSHWMDWAQRSPPRTRSRKSKGGNDENWDPNPRRTYRFPFMKRRISSVPSNWEWEDDEEVITNFDFEGFVPEKSRSRLEWFSPEKSSNQFEEFSPEKVSFHFEGFSPEKQSRRRSSHFSSFNPNVNVLMPENVTQDMLDSVSQSSTGKLYSAAGTTCHQCRQKTLDMKTVCRSGECVGVRGTFCGTCLRNRYGEKVEEALMDPDWSCPPCRHICNCSICRNRQGKPATGILINLARAKGYSNVNDYLAYLLMV